MSLIVRKFNAQVKDPDTGQMVPAGLLSSDSLEAIDTAKTTAINAIQQNGTQQVAAIQQKGVETRASIPDDYTELSDSVSDLKTQFKDELCILAGSGNTYAGENTYMNLNPGSTYRISIKKWSTTGIPSQAGIYLARMGYTNDDTKVYLVNVLTTEILNSEYSFYVPYNAVNPKFFMGGRIESGTDAIVTVENIDTDILTKLTKDGLAFATGYEKPDLANRMCITWSSSSEMWTYTGVGTDACTLSGTLYKLKKYDKIVLSDYTGVKFSVYTKNSSDVYTRYTERTTAFTATEDCECAIQIWFTPRKALTVEDYIDLWDRLYIIHFNEGIIDYVNNQTNSLKEVTTTYIKGFVNATGYIEADATYPSISTDFIQVENGYKFAISLQYTESRSIFLRYCLYDSTQTKIGNIVTIANNVSGTSYEAQFTINNENAKYIRISYRAFDGVTAKIYCTENTGILYLKSLEFDVVYNAVSQPKAFQSVNHRGYCTTYPENTLKAFSESKRKGFNIVETDIRFTSDSVPVLLHDESINRTARNADGTELEETVNIADITYLETQTYDFGIYKGEQFAGTKIPTFKEFLKRCRDLSLSCYVELKAGTESQIKGLVDIVDEYNMTDYVTWIAGSSTYLAYIKAKNANARLGVVLTSISSSSVDAIEALRSGTNSVFADVSYNASTIATEIATAKENGIPLEVWVIDYIPTILSLDLYITGVTSNQIVAGAVLYRNAISET